MVVYDFEGDLADEDPPRAPRNGTGYLFSMTMAVVLIIVALALLKAVAGPTSHDARRGSATVEAVLTPTPHSEPIPATDPRPREEPI